MTLALKKSNNTKYIIKKMINLAIRATYFIFCRRNKIWDSSDFFVFVFYFVSG